MKKTGAQMVVSELIEQGVDVVFGYPGGAALFIYDALYERRGDIRHILTSHEQGAAHAADGYARSTGKVGVCLATSGPGATNLVTGLATAYLDSVPMVAITCNVGMSLLGRDSFQEVDITGVTVPVTKHNFFVKDVEQIPEIVHKAFTIAASGRPGPVLIDIPKDLTITESEYKPTGHYTLRPTPVPELAELEEAVRLLNAAQRPLIHFGGGILSSGAENELIALAEKQEIPLASTSMGLSAVPYNHPLYLGMVGMHGTPVSNEALEECDVLLSVGTRFSDRVAGSAEKFAPHAKIIHVDIDSSELGKNVAIDAPILGDAKEVLGRLEAMVEPAHHEGWLSVLRLYETSHPVSIANHVDGVNPRKVIKEVARLTDYGAYVVTDVGQHQMLVAQKYPFTKPRTFISSLGLGTMGYGLGAANGVKVAHPTDPVVLFTGDGCFHMNMPELAVGVTEGFPVVVIVMNNGVLGMVRQWQKLFYEERYSSTYLNRKTDYAAVAEAMGARGMVIESDDEIEQVLREALAVKDCPVVIDCRIGQNDDVYPIIPAGQGFAGMILEG